MYRAAVVALLLSLSTFVTAADGQSLQSRASEIRAAMDARNFQRAESLVRGLRASDPAAFTANNYEYLLARLTERRGARAEAASLYQSLLNRKSNLAQYALWHLAAIARQSGDLALERQYITRLLASFPSSVLVSPARNRMIDSLGESGEHRATVSLLRQVASPSGVRGRGALADLGEAYLKAGDRAAARAAFEPLASGSSRDDYALRASLGLDEIERASGARPNEFDALRRARIYLHNRHWSEARARFLDVVEQYPDSPNRPEALYQTGFTFYREDNQDEAIKWFERVHREFPLKKEGEEGYYWVGTALQKAQRYDEAAKRYIDFITAYPASERIEGAYRNAIDCFRFAGKNREAIEWSRRMGQLYAGKSLAAVALFNEARIELVQGHYEAALQLLTKLQAQPIYPRVASAPIRGEAAFLRIYAIEQMGRLSEAARLYLAVPDERDNYFGQRATLRLQAMGASERGRGIIESLARSYREQARAALEANRYGEAKDAATQALRLVANQEAQRDLYGILRASYSRLPGYSTLLKHRLLAVGRAAIEAGQPQPAGETRQSLAAELMFLGLYDEGVTELRLAGFGGARASDGAGDEQPEENSPRLVQASAAASAGDVAYSLAVYANRGDQAQYAIAFAEPLFKSIPQDYRLELMPRDLVEMQYPAPYRDALNRYSPALGVDARLVLALARQESRFNPTVKSSATARGLLQFIPETALKLANEEGLKNFELDDVYNPEIAIRLAVRNVADLFKLFPDNPYAVAASYNTYDTNVERWIFRARSSDIDRFVAEIALPETKDYVAKVMNNYRAYRQLYTEDLMPRRQL